MTGARNRPSGAAARAAAPTGPVSAHEYAMMVAARMSEAQFQDQLDSLGDELGWLCYHTHDSRGSQRGFLDWVAVRGPRLIFAELKIQDERKGKVTAEQERWMGRLQLVGQAVADEVLLNGGATLGRTSLGPAGAPSVETYLWRPIDITTNTITEILR